MALQENICSTLNEQTNEPNAAYIYKQIEIPHDAKQVIFDLRFASAGQGDVLTLSIEDKVLIIIDAGTVGDANEYSSSYPAYIGDYAGQTVNLQIALRGTGANNSTAYIDNLRFVDVALAADIDENRQVDILDLQILAGNWLGVGCQHLDNCDGADINIDNYVNLLDFALLTENWLIGVEP